MKTRRFAVRLITRPAFAVWLVLCAVLAAGDANAFTPDRTAPEGPRALILLSQTTLPSCLAVEKAVEGEGGRVASVFRPAALFAFLPEEKAERIRSMPEVLDIRYGPAERGSYGPLDRDREAGIEIWNRLYLGIGNQEPPPGVEPAPQRDYACGIAVPAEYRSEAFSAEKKGYGATFHSTSEYFILDGANSRHERFHVNFVFPESNGDIDASSEDWLQADMTTMLVECLEGIEWWAARYGPARISVVAATTWEVPTPWEPITHPWNFESIWVDDLMDTLGYGGANYFSKVRSFDNNYLVSANETWFNTLFIVNSKNDGDGRFAADGLGVKKFDYSYFGGPFLVMTWDNGPWGNDDTDYLCAHETGHTFYALDEYAASGCSDSQRAGYLNALNGNCEAGPEDTVLCIMANYWRSEYTNGAVCEYSRDQIGWRDTDGDSIPDIVDHPPILSLGSSADSVLCGVVPIYTGGVVPEVEPNLNPMRESTGSSSGDSISVNSVALVEYRLDGGAWQPATPVDGAWDEADESYSFAPGLQEGRRSVIEVRARNSRGLYSAVAADTIAMASAFLWVDSLDDGDASDWTISTTGASSLSLDGTQSHSAPWSFYVAGGSGSGDGATAASPDLTSPPFPYVDLGDPYTISFWIRWSSFHWARLVLFGHVGIILDYPSYPIKYDKNGDWSGLTSLGSSFQSYIPANTWGKVEISVDPGAREYSVSLGGTYVGTATYNASFTPSASLSFRDHGSATDYINAWYDDFWVSGCGAPVPTLVAEAGPPPGRETRPLAGRPNPFNPSTWISYEIPRSGLASLRIYNVSGALVRTLFDRPVTAGSGSVVWDGRSDQGEPAASGTYLLLLSSGSERVTGRVVLIR
ncbi:MAG: FlgD immunoglobulin-like domain containing protein [Candidatus Eisenbacteria bacterium]